SSRRRFGPAESTGSYRGLRISKTPYLPPTKPATLMRSPLWTCLTIQGWLNQTTLRTPPESSCSVASAISIFLNFACLEKIVSTVAITVAWVPALSEAIDVGSPYPAQANGRAARTAAEV